MDDKKPEEKENKTPNPMPAPVQRPSMGRIVLFLSEVTVGYEDVVEEQEVVSYPVGVKELRETRPVVVGSKPVKETRISPAIVINHINDTCVDLQVFGEPGGIHRNVVQGTSAGQWDWPPRT